MSGSQAPTPPSVGEELSSAINTLSSQGGQLVNAETSVSPQLSALNTQNNLNNVTSLSNAYFGSGTGSLLQAETGGVQAGAWNMASQAGSLNQYENPVTSILNQANSQYTQPVQAGANQFLNTGVDSTMSSLANLQANYGSSINPALNDISAGSSMAGSVLGSGMARSALLPGQQGPEALSSGTQQLVDTTSQQLALGGSISPQEQDMVSQASRAADSARGIFNSNASASNELLNLDQFSQQRLATREAAASNAQGLANTQLQQNVVNRQNALAGASSIFNTGQQTALGALTSGAALNLQGYSQASATQQAALGQQYNYQNSGLNQLAYLASLGQQNSTNAANFVNANSGANGAQGYANLFSSGIGTYSGSPANSQPSVFNGLGLFGAAQDAANTAYNGKFASGEQNAQASNSLMGAGIGAVGSILGIGAVAL